MAGIHNGNYSNPINQIFTNTLVHTAYILLLVNLLFDSTVPYASRILDVPVLILARAISAISSPIYNSATVDLFDPRTFATRKPAHTLSEPLSPSWNVALLPYYNKF